MHIEILVEDSSGEKLLEAVLPKLLGEQGDPHSWRVHAYKGIGRIPKNLNMGIDAVVVVLDSDRRNCVEFLGELKELAAGCNPAPHTLFRIAIEEMEAWYFGDQQALTAAYPKAKSDVLGRYRQDSVCDTWELLVDAIYPGGSTAIKKAGWPLPGQVSMNGRKRSAHCWSRTAIFRQALASCAMDCAAW